MKIYVLTSIGKSLAANPSNNAGPAMQVLFWLRKRGGQGTEEQIADQLFGGNRLPVRIAMNNLIRNKAVQCVVNA